MLKLLVKLLATEAAKELAVYIVHVIAQRTDNTVDDTAVRLSPKLWVFRLRPDSEMA